tara:strand:+ start:8076 stop:8192 length:117 start_codon:yes stop_codon:yes gene_type:complete
VLAQVDESLVGRRVEGEQQAVPQVVVVQQPRRREAGME